MKMEPHPLTGCKVTSKFGRNQTVTKRTCIRIETIDPRSIFSHSFIIQEGFWGGWFGWV